MSPEPGTILLLTADCAMAEQVLPFFKQSGLFMERAADGAKGLSRFLEVPFAALVLDMALPVLDGLGMLHEIRMRSTQPVVIVAAREEECIRGLEGGADDWLLKPCDPSQLLTRIRVLWRLRAKSVANAAGMLSCGAIALSLHSHEAWLEGNALPLTNIEFAILKCLLRSAGRVVSRDELAAVLYQRQATPFERAIDVHISHVRRKLQQSGAASIRTIRGSGYLLAATAQIKHEQIEIPINDSRIEQQLAC